jgi:hypothetical protein
MFSSAVNSSQRFFMTKNESILLVQKDAAMWFYDPQNTHKAAPHVQLAIVQQSSKPHIESAKNNPKAQLFAGENRQ